MDDTNTPINPQALLNHFKTLNEINITPDLTNIPNISLPYVPELDDEITYDHEVKQAINRLKTNRAPGIDAIPAEVYKALNPFFANSAVQPCPNHEKLSEIMVYWHYKTNS